MKTNYFICCVTLLIIFTVFSCRKSDPQPQGQIQTATPVFSFSGSINGYPVNIQAGFNGYYNYSYYVLDSSGVMEYSSQLKIQNCSSNCSNTITVSIKDHYLFSGVSTPIDSAVFNGYYAFSAPSGAPSQFEQTFVGGLLKGNGATYNWNFGDHTPSVLSSSPSVTHKYLRPGIYNVTLDVEDSSGTCSSSIVNNVKVGEVGNPVTASFYSSNGSGTSVSFASVPVGGVTPYTYNWNFGDGTSATSANPVHQYASAGIYLTSLSITDAAGNTDVQNANVPVSSSGSSCASYFYSSTVVPVIDPFNLSSVIIQWRDANGVLWTSYNDKQNSGKSMFKIISVQGYINNELGQPTKKITAEVACTLYNGTNTITINNATITFAVAYK